MAELLPLPWHAALPMQLSGRSNTIGAIVGLPSKEHRPAGKNMIALSLSLSLSSFCVPLTSSKVCLALTDCCKERR